MAKWQSVWIKSGLYAGMALGAPDFPFGSRRMRESLLTGSQTIVSHATRSAGHGLERPALTVRRHAWPVPAGQDEALCLGGGLRLRDEQRDHGPPAPTAWIHYMINSQMAHAVSLVYLNGFVGRNYGSLYLLLVFDSRIILLTAV
jgi:hypothetical protein